MSWNEITGKIEVFVRNYRRALTIFAIILLVILIYGGYMMYLASVETTSGTKQKRHLAAVEEAREGLRDDEKTPLTSDFLAEEYKIYVKGENRFAIMGFVALAVISCAFCVVMGYVLVKVIRSGIPGYDYDVIMLLRLGFALLALIFVTVIMTTLAVGEIKKKLNLKRPDIVVQAIDIVRKESGTREYTTSEGAKRSVNYYYLRCEEDGASRTLEVPFEIFDRVMDPGTYYLAFVSKSTGDDYISIYPAAEYAWPA